MSATRSGADRAMQSQRIAMNAEDVIYNASLYAEDDFDELDDDEIDEDDLV